jgi:hypothetical protein
MEPVQILMEYVSIPEGVTADVRVASTKCQFQIGSVRGRRVYLSNRLLQDFGLT